MRPALGERRSGLGDRVAVAGDLPQAPTRARIAAMSPTGRTSIEP